MDEPASQRERARIRVAGIVQGVGFRPFVHGLATRFDLAGYVLNRAGTVEIEVEGDAATVDRFVSAVQDDAPPLAVIESFVRDSVPPTGESRFVIRPSDSSERGQVFISPDVAPCAACLAEMRDPGDRRYGYPFLNCTHCGPRLTIIEGSPYDRERTAMKVFPMCSDCRREYEDPQDRRFHAEPTACAACGPRMLLMSSDGDVQTVTDPIVAAATALCDGRIGAIKGLGGYHLACDATTEEVVAALRRRKHRDEKPFALMVADLQAARKLCHVDDAEAALLTSVRRPIVLLRRRPEADIADGVAPGNPTLGVMLPYTPQHHLLLAAAQGLPLVMTSGNLSDEPIAHEDDDARERLRAIADFFLVHDREIRVRCDDSVARVLAGEELLIRRSRGYAPQPLPLPSACPRPMLAVGAMLKNTFGLGRGRHAFVSHHVGDLNSWSTYLAFGEAVAHYEALFDIRPEVIVHDAHPGYDSTRYALERAAAQGLETVAVQHHHAHFAACLAEHGHPGPAIGVSFDGTGWGDDGAVWGGEVLLGNSATARRAAHLRYVAMPGGEQAIREPWRMALAHLLDAAEPLDAVGRWADSRAVRTCQTMVERELNAPRTSSMGRLFDAVAALVGLRGRVRYEGQAAMELEWLSESAGVAIREGAGSAPYIFALEGQDTPSATTVPPLIIDARPVIRAVVRDLTAGVEAATMARRFHDAVVAMIVRVCGRLREGSGCDAVALSGGVFLNGRLVRTLVPRLTADGFRVLRHRRVPPGDGGIAYGQLATATARLVG